MISKLLLGLFFLAQFSCNDQTAEHQKANTIDDKRKAFPHSMIGKDKDTSAYSEHWTWQNETSNFEIDLIRTKDSIRGKYCAIAYKGSKIDCSDDTSSNYLTGIKVGNAFHVTFNSAFDNENEKDTAYIIYEQKGKELTWIRKSSNLIAYVPDKAVLR